MPKSAAVRSGPRTARHTPERPSLEDCVRRGTRGRDLVGVDEAARRFGDDLAAEIEAIKAGTHPLQERARSIMELHGLGAETWKGVAPDAYVGRLRKEWDERGG